MEGHDYENSPFVNSGAASQIPNKHKFALTKPTFIMLTIQSILNAALLLSLVHACPYLAREQENQAAARQQSNPHQNVRRAQAKPTTVSAAIQTATQQIQQIITANKGMDAKFLRLSFHDCAGGCDGCVDMSSPSNAGLDAPIDILAPVVQLNQQFLTTGDVWALAGLVASRVTQKGTTVKFPLQFVGRRQCEGNATKAGPPRELPSAQFTTKKVVDYFQRTFNFSPDETVAILGAHTLYVGSTYNAHRHNSSLLYQR
jgi:Peroxidase